MTIPRRTRRGAVWKVEWDGRLAGAGRPILIAAYLSGQGDAGEVRRDAVAKRRQHQRLQALHAFRVRLGHVRRDRDVGVVHKQVGLLRAGQGGGPPPSGARGPEKRTTLAHRRTGLTLAADSNPRTKPGPKS
jgi:hypothetical protein